MSAHQAAGSTTRRRKEVAWARRIERGDLAARGEMVEANMRLVAAVARGHQGQGVPFEDLVQEGTLGLMRAVERFDWRRGVAFSTYAVWWIRQAMTRALADGGRPVRLPVHQVERLRRVRAAEARLHVALGRSPADEDVARASGVAVADVRLLRAAEHPVVSLDAPARADGETSLGELLPDPEAEDAFRSAARADDARRVRALVDGLDAREQTILRRHYGLDGDEEPISRIGRDFGLTDERIRQIERAALGRLRVLPAAQPLAQAA